VPDIYIPGAGISIPASQCKLPDGKYEGYTLNQVPEGLLKISHPAVIYVSGSGGNPFGHALFMISPSIGYVHAADPGLNKSRFIPHDEYSQFMEEMEKSTWSMLPVKLGNKQAAAAYIRQCLLVGFDWQPWHNCVTLCINICQHGQSNVIPTSVFPSTATTAPGNILKPAFSHPYDSIGNDDL
jgi:hypothetical protein